MAIKDVFHVNVNGTDLERSRAFSERVGCKVVHEFGHEGTILELIDFSGDRR